MNKEKNQAPLIQIYLNDFFRGYKDKNSGEITRVFPIEIIRRYLSKTVFHSKDSKILDTILENLNESDHELFELSILYDKIKTNEYPDITDLFSIETDRRHTAKIIRHMNNKEGITVIGDKDCEIARMLFEYTIENYVNKRKILLTPEDRRYINEVRIDYDDISMVI